MDPVTNMIECPIDEEWSFHKADLLVVKDTEKGYLNGRSYYAYNIPGVRFYLSVYPNGNNEERRGQTWIFLYVNGSEGRKISANFFISIKSANYESKSIEHVYQQKAFVNGEIRIAIKGILKFARPLVTKISSPLSMQWKIREADLLPLKESNYGCLKSKRFIVSSFSDVKYYLQIYPNGNKAENQGQTWIFLNIEIGNEKKIEAVFDFSIESANRYRTMQYVFEKSYGWGNNICSTTDLFDPSKNFIVDGFFTLNVNGILMVERKNQVTTLKLQKGVATQAVQKKKNKEFTIVVDGKQIKVHKKVLSDASPVFAGMLESGMKEARENKMEIADFTFDIVDAAIKLCYSAGIRKLTTIEDLLSLYKFADKYDIKRITEHVEEELTKKVSSAYVCQLIDFSKSFNVTKLYQKCVDFLMKCAKEGTPVCGENILDKDLLAQMFLNCLRPAAETEA